MSSALPELVNAILNPHDLLLDGTKVGFYKERIEAWQRGEKISPITMDVAWTRKCNYACEFCYATMQASQGKEITRDIAFQFLEDAAEIGVKGVSLISDGESSVVPFYADSIEHGAKVGLKMGIGTNGKVLKKSMLERILPHLAYLRFNFSGGTREGYSRIMGVKPEWFDLVVQNIKDAMEIKRRDNLSVTINMQLVLDPKNFAELIPFAKLAAEIRPDYAIIKHCADDVDHTLGTDYTKYQSLDAIFDKVESLGDKEFRIVVKRERMKDEGKRDYSKCYGPPFITQMSGNGLIAPCGFLFNEKYKAFHIGNICDTRFKDLFESDRYWEVMRYLASDEFDPRKRCGPNCLQTQTNSFLYHYVNGEVQLPVGTPPPHLEFL
ncbi:MAG: radical SAM protein [Candidatus Berkelbacteria bacterium]|nr:radical SAM protein [Candidatus Berkelbacteria bacterium]